MYLQIKKAELVKDEKFNSHHIKITMVGLYENDGKWIKWVKLNEKTLKNLLEAQLKYQFQPDVP